MIPVRPAESLTNLLVANLAKIWFLNASPLFVPLHGTAQKGEID
jgi:hypothetical protein